MAEFKITIEDMSGFSGGANQEYYCLTIHIENGELKKIRGQSTI